MMKNTLSIIFLLLSHLSLAQPITSVEVELVWEGPINVRGDLIRKIYQIKEGHFMVKDYYQNGELQMIGNYQSVDPEIEDGEFVFFHSNGQKSHQGNYKNGVLAGEWCIYDETGEIMNKINYDFNINETSKPTNINSDVEIMADFVGKDFTVETEKVDNLKEYLSSEIVYPPRAYKYNIQGKVYVQFNINEDGSISNALVVRKLDKDLDKEAMRIVRNMPNWKPARNRNDEPIAIAYTCPVVFIIND